MRFGSFVAFCVGSAATVLALTGTPRSAVEAGSGAGPLPGSTSPAPTLDFVLWFQSPVGESLMPTIVDGKQAFLSHEEVVESTIHTHLAGAGKGQGSGLKSRFMLGGAIGDLDSIATVENGFFLGPQSCPQELEIKSEGVIRLADASQSSVSFAGKGTLQCALVAGRFSFLSAVNARVVPGSGTGFFLGMQGSVVSTFHADLLSGHVSEVVTFRLIPPP